MIMMTVKQFRNFKGSDALIRPNEYDGSIIIEAWKYPPVTSIGTNGLASPLIIGMLQTL